MLIYVHYFRNIPSVGRVVNADRVDNDYEDIVIVQLRNERRRRRGKILSPQPMKTKVQDDVESEEDYGLDVGQN